MEKIYIKDGKNRREALEVVCSRCGKAFLKRKDHALKAKDDIHYCSLDCHNMSQKEMIYIENKKYCSGCKQYKSRSEFYNKSNSNTVRSQCKLCTDQKRINRMPAIRENNKKRYSQIKQQGFKNKLKQQYNMSLDEYEAKKQSQNNVCAICGNPEDVQLRKSVCGLSVDHCHTTGRIRGLLCRRCNSGIGLFKEDINLLESAKQYIINWREIDETI